MYTRLRVSAKVSPSLAALEEAEALVALAICGLGNIDVFKEQVDHFVAR